MEITVGGGYVLERTLGESPLGTAVLARGAVSGRPVLVKILAGHLAGDEPARARFFRAADLALRLSHPNVVRVLDAGIDGCPFLVMEHVDGETLAARLARGALSADETLTLATHLAAGLAHAHASGVVHGCLAPDTILLGRDGVARLADFGLARLLDGDESARRLPGPAADIYAFGAVLRQVAPDDVPPGLVAIIDAALAPHPAARPLAVDLLHQLLTMNGTAPLWIAPAVASVWNTPTPAAGPSAAPVLNGARLRPADQVDADVVVPLENQDDGGALFVR